MTEGGTYEKEEDGAKTAPAIRHIIPISGKDSLATAIWQTAHEPDLPYEFVFNDTRAELPETYEWLDRVESVLGIKIVRIGKCLEQVIDEQGILPSPRIRFCTERAKIIPMDRFIGKGKAIVYFGIVDMRGLMPPSFFWQRLYDAVSQQMGGEMGIVESWPTWLRARVFAWRSRPNCFFCFFQRRYEWVGLLEFHPDLFDRAEAIELRVGHGDKVRRSTEFQWIAEDYPLSKIREKADEIFAKRVAVVCKLINNARQGDLFQDALDEMDIAGTSCGLLCGK